MQTASQKKGACNKCSKVPLLDDGSDALKRCSGCHTALYCSKDCQKADWGTSERPSWHRLICGCLKHCDWQALASHYMSAMQAMLTTEGGFAADQFPAIRSKFIKDHPEHSKTIPVLVISLKTDRKTFLNLEEGCKNAKMWLESAVILLAQEALKDIGQAIIAPEMEQLLTGDVFANKDLQVTVSPIERFPYKVNRASADYAHLIDPKNVPCYVLVGIKDQPVSVEQFIIIKKAEPQEEEESAAAAS